MYTNTIYIYIYIYTHYIIYIYINIYTLVPRPPTNAITFNPHTLLKRQERRRRRGLCGVVSHLEETRPPEDGRQKAVAVERLSQTKSEAKEPGTIPNEFWKGDCEYDGV